MTAVEDFLKHHGVKGMHWGVRRSVRTSSGSSMSKTKSHTSADAAKAKEFRNTAKKSGTHALSNQELQHLVNRMNLEQQYKRLSSSTGNKAKIQKGHKAAKEIISFGKTMSDVHSIITGSGFKSIKKAIEINFDGISAG